MEMGRILAQEKGYGELCGLLGRAYLWGAGLLGAFYLAMWAMLRLQVALAPKADRAVREYVEGIAAKYGCKGCRDIRVRRSPSPYVGEAAGRRLSRGCRGSRSSSMNCCIRGTGTCWSISWYTGCGW